MQVASAEKRIVRIGIGQLDQPMTLDHARRYGARNLPHDLKAAGFTTFVSASDAELHGGLWFRIDYGKTFR